MSDKPRKVKTWVWVLVALFGLGILAVIAMAGVGFYVFSRHVETSAIGPAEAYERFAEIQMRFEGQKPLIELDERGEFLRTNPDRPDTSAAQSPSALHVMAFDSDDGQMVRLSIPFWLLRLQTGGTIDVGRGDMNLEDLKLTVEDLERFGPTLIVDHRDPRGSRVLVWSQ